MATLNTLMGAGMGEIDTRASEGQTAVPVHSPDPDVRPWDPDRSRPRFPPPPEEA
ncbi:hypothetical protein [Blastococcus sp. CT_GayMR20]|uniref:hypothetical protein n=1 Tax=Blastococcus sp. CT_GayMR20 TaxID=2559609 RepID=UPI001430DD6D|nr:hypothetical protein [Blastococcus sp. CT_GayMR20]